MTLRPSDYDSNGDIIPDSVRENKGDTISRSALKDEIVNSDYLSSDEKSLFLSRIDNAPTVETPKGEWEYEHELSCGRILKLRLNVVEHKCNKCKHWSIKWAGTIPDNFCSHCGEVMRKAEAKPKMSGKERFCSDVLCNQNYGGWCTSECPKKQEKEEET